MIAKPILVTSDKRYVWAHVDGRVLGPFNYPSSPESNYDDPHGLPFNPTACIGGKIHEVSNPYALDEMRTIMAEALGEA